MAAQGSCINENAWQLWSLSGLRGFGGSGGTASGEAEVCHRHPWSSSHAPVSLHLSEGFRALWCVGFSQFCNLQMHVWPSLSSDDSLGCCSKDEICSGPHRTGWRAGRVGWPQVRAWSVPEVGRRLQGPPALSIRFPETDIRAPNALK